MKISNKTKYGIQFMLNLAVSYGDEYTNIKDIAQKENISVKFLENIVSIIKPSELIKVKRGASGGYRLSKSPLEISLLEIIELLEGEVFQNENMNENTGHITDICFITNNFLERFQKNASDFLQNITLAELVKEFHNKQNNYMFYI